MSLPDPGPDRTCVVTGASSGIGQEIARLLAARGFGVTLVARRAEKLKELAGELSAAHGVRAEVLPADLADVDARAALVPAIEELGLRVDVLVNNAGSSTMGPIRTSDAVAEINMLRTNVEAPAHLCSLFVPGMADRGRGAVLNVASTAAFQPLPGQAGYGATKAFVLSYTNALRAELAGTGVSVTALCPGPVETGFGQAAGLTDEEASGSLPKMMWVPAAEVAKAAVDGLDAGRRVVIPGRANKLGAAAGYLVPRKLLLPILARQHPSLK